MGINQKYDSLMPPSIFDWIDRNGYFFFFVFMKNFVNLLVLYSKQHNLLINESIFSKHVPFFDSKSNGKIVELLTLLSLQRNPWSSKRSSDKLSYEKRNLRLEFWGMLQRKKFLKSKLQLPPEMSGKRSELMTIFELWGNNLPIFAPDLFYLILVNVPPGLVLHSWRWLSRVRHTRTE